MQCVNFEYRCMQKHLKMVCYYVSNLILNNRKILYIYRPRNYGKILSTFTVDSRCGVSCTFFPFLVRLNITLYKVGGKKIVIFEVTIIIAFQLYHDISLFDYLKNQIMFIILYWIVK